MSSQQNTVVHLRGSGSSTLPCEPKVNLKYKIMSIQLMPKIEKRTMKGNAMAKIQPKQTTQSTSNTLPQFVQFINQLEGWKTKCKNLHWAAEKNNIHIRLDEFLKILSDYQDTVAEGIMGVLCTHLGPNDVKGDPGTITCPMEFICNVLDETLKFYQTIPDEPLYAGLKSECETFIFNVNKYSYLFSLTDCKNKK